MCRIHFCLWINYVFKLQLVICFRDEFLVEFLANSGAFMFGSKTTRNVCMLFIKLISGSGTKRNTKFSYNNFSRLPITVLKLCFALTLQYLQIGRRGGDFHVSTCGWRGRGEGNKHLRRARRENTKFEGEIGATRGETARRCHTKTAKSFGKTTKRARGEGSVETSRIPREVKPWGNCRESSVPRTLSPRPPHRPRGLLHHRLRRAGRAEPLPVVLLLDVALQRDAVHLAHAGAQVLHELAPAGRVDELGR